MLQFNLFSVAYKPVFSRQWQCDERDKKDRAKYAVYITDSHNVAVKQIVLN